jgi:hypothetical protein
MEAVATMEAARRNPAAGPTPEALEFVRFCYRRRRIGWPELYDEMCAVAGRGRFQGWGAEELAAAGIGLSLFEMPGLAALAARVIAEENASRVLRETSQTTEARRDGTPRVTANDAAGESSASEVRTPFRLAPGSI